MMAEKDYQFLSVGENCLFIKLGETIDPLVNKKVKKLADYLEQHPFPGYVEFVATYTGTAVNYNPWIVSRELAQAGEGPANAVKKLMHVYVAASASLPDSKPDVVDIPVCYGGEYGPDLAFVAKYNNLLEQEVIDIHSGGEYLCYMIGFCPGFPYLGGMDSRIATPRRQTPRISIPARSIGIAGQQTGGYPLSTPGGWQIIGRSAIEMYNPSKEPPALLKAGDIVHFRSVSKAKYLEIRGGAQ